jgi:hypothetical protein
MNKSIGHGGVNNNPLTNSPYFGSENYGKEITPPVMNRMLFEDGDPMLFEDGDLMLFEND